MGIKSLCFVFGFVGLSYAVVVPISSGGRAHSVVQGLSGNSSDSIIDQLIRATGDYDKSVGILGQVDNPGAVAKELEEDIEFLKRRDEVERNGTGGSEDEIRRVLDGFVYFKGFCDGGLRPGSIGIPTLVTVKAEVHPWFSFDERRNELRLSITLAQVWDDERIAFKDRLKTPGGVKEVTLTSHMNHIEIWVPDTYVLNGKESASTEGVVRVSAEGTVQKEQRMTVAVKCKSFGQTSFPFDRIVCSVWFGSYMWNSSEVSYKWSGKVVKDVSGFEWSGYRVEKVKTFEIEQGEKSGLSLEFHLERGLSRFVYRFYLPLGCLCLLGILGLVRGVTMDGGLVCCATFGVMNVFMGLSYGWEEMGWRSYKNSMDSYFGFCVFTVFSCFVVNMIRGRNGSASKGVAGQQESYEMEDNCIGRRNKASRGFFMESSGEGDVSRSTEATRASAVVKSFRIILGKGMGVLGGCCVWMNDFSVVLMVGLFVSWNILYWGMNLLGR